MIDADEDKVYLNEINTIPGSLAFYLWEPVGVKYPRLLDKMVSLALKRERELKNLNFTFKSNILAEAKLGGVKGGKLNGWGGTDTAYRLFQVYGQLRRVFR